MSRLPESFKELDDRAEYLRQAFGGTEVKATSSVRMPDGGLLVGFATGEEARRFAAMMKALLPDKARYLVEISDCRVLLKVPGDLAVYVPPVA